jgi:hypothetical protein
MPEAKRSLGNLSPAIQVVVKNRMNLDNNHWERIALKMKKAQPE